MAEGQTLTEEIATIKIHAGIGGVLLLVCGLLSIASGLAVIILHDQVDLFEFPLFTIGFVIGGFLSGLWATFSGISLLALAYKGKAQSGKQLYLRMIEFKQRWFLFFNLIQIAGIALLGVALRTSGGIDERLLALTITVIAGCGLSLLVSLLGSLNLSKCTDKFGLKLTPPSKDSLLTVFKTHGYVILFISLHQIAWALVGFIMPEFAVTENSVRIAAFIIGGCIVSLLGILTAVVCFKIVRNVSSSNQNSRVMTSTLVKVHQAWVWVFIGLNIVGTGLYIASISSIGFKKENGEWTLTSPLYMVANYVFSLLGNVLLGYLFLAVAHYETFQNVLGFHLKPTPSVANNTPAKPSTAGTGAKTAKKVETKPAANTSKGGTPAKAAATAAKHTVNVTEASGSNSNANLPSTSGATGTTTTVPDIEEVKERNRLLQEQIALQKQLNDLRQQQLHAPNDSVLYSGNNVQIGPAHPGMPPVYTSEPSAPPSYDEVTSYPDKPN